MDAPATMMNVCGDIPSAMLIDKFVNRQKPLDKDKNKRHLFKRRRDKGEKEEKSNE